ncbi:MAG: lamin tail domain-containing protein, partial [Nitrososphaera sp.]
MSIKLVAILILLLTIAIPAVGSSSAQSSNNMTASEIVDLVHNSTNTTNPTGLGNETDSVDGSPFVNDTETSDLGATDIVINEVELNPRGSDLGNEWIELYNPADVEANVSGFEIRTSFKSATIKLPSEAVIEPNGTYVVEIDGQMLSNTAESLTLANASGNIVDKTPSLVDKNDDGRTWQRIPDGNNEWKFAVGTQDELNDPDGQASATYTARAGSTVQCHGTAGCAEGMVTRIVDGDTLYVRVNGTDYKVDLALASAPPRT